MNEEKLEKFIKDMGITLEEYQKQMIVITMTNYSQKYICVPRGLGCTTMKKGKMKNE